MVISVATVTYLVKIFYHVFLKKNDKEYKDLVFDISSLDLALGSISIIIILIGTNPNFIMKNLIEPQLFLTTYNPHFILEHLSHISFFGFKDVLFSTGIILVGIIVFLIVEKFRLFRIKLPKRLSVEYILFIPLSLIMKSVCLLIYGKKCPINQENIKKLQETGIQKTSFIDRIVITANVINERYEKSIIRSDALIYTFFITIILIIMLILKF